MEKRESVGIKYLKILWTIMTLLGAAYLFLGEWLLPEDQLGAGGWCEKFETEWEQVFPDGSRIPVKIPGRCEVTQDHEATVETVLPMNLEHNTFLRFWSQRQDMEIYVDGELRQEYTTKNNRLFGRTSSAALVFFELRPEDGGKRLTVNTRSDSDYAGVWRTVYIGDQLGIWMETFHESGAEVVVAFLVLVLSVISILVSKTLRFYYHKKVDLEYLGWTVLVASIWLIGNSVFRQIFFPNISVASDITFYCIMLIPIPFLVYMNSIQQGRYQRIYVGVGWVSAVNLVGCTILQVSGWKDFTDTITCMEAVDFLVIAVVLLMMLLDLYHKKIREYLWIAVGILGVCFAAVAQMLLYSFKTDIPFQGIILAVGLVFLLVMAVFSTMRGILHMERERSEALMASEAKAKFLANMSHEIRTPLNAVLGLDEIIIRESQEKHIRDYARDIQGAGRSLLSLINDILDFSKIESGRLELVEEEYEPMSLLNDLSIIFLNRIGKKPVELLYDIDKELPMKLYGDSLRLRQIIINIVNNAVKFTEEGYVKLTLRVEDEDEEDMRLVFSVKDTGQGIREEDIGRLFDSFQQVDTKKNHYKEGTGLGLAISKQLVELMGGGIQVESEYGKGSEFIFTVYQKRRSEKKAAVLKEREELPVVGGKLKDFYVKDALIKLTADYGLSYLDYDEAKAQGKQVDFLFTDQGDLVGELEEELKIGQTSPCLIQNPMLGNSWNTKTAMINKPLYSLNFCQAINHEISESEERGEDALNFVAEDARILIVDDNEMNLKVAKGLLEPLKMHIDTAENGRKALEMICSNTYDLVFMDHMMPVMDGIEATEKLRKMEGDYYQKLPVIALTANAIVDARDGFLKAGMNDFVAKPIKMKEICKKLRKWLPKELITEREETVQSQVLEGDLPQIEGLDVREGILNSGTKELFMNLLGDFYKLIELKAVKIEKCLADGMLRDYTIEVHALKNTSRMIGAVELSEEFYHLEQLGNEENQRALEEETPRVLELFRSYLPVLKPYAMEANDKKETASKEVLGDLLEQMYHAVDSFDFDEADRLLKELEKYRMPENCQKDMERLQACVADVAMEEILQLTKEMEDRLKKE